MKNILRFCLVPLIVLTSSGLYAQVGIGTTEPDASSMLDVFSNDKGLLMPRLSTAQRDAMVLPASGLMIYNTTLNDGQLNTGTPSLPSWKGIKVLETPLISSVSAGANVSTIATEYEVVPGLTFSPAAGTYLVLFNAQISSIKTFSSEQGVTDVNTIYTTLKNYPGGKEHALVFGNNETLDPGVYDVTGAPSIAGSLTLNGAGDPNALFIIRGTGAFTTGAGTVINLTNGANANNIFWVSEAAMSTGDPTTMKGTLISHGAAVALGANTVLEGRMMSTLGALTVGALSTVTAPTGSSIINLGVLSSFAMFSASGGISGCPDCSVTGDVGTGAGAATSFHGIKGTVYPPGTTSNPSSSSYTIYQNGTEVAFASRTNVESPTVSLQASVTVETGQSIEIRWKVLSGEAVMNNRTFSIIRSH
jgi:hypothetical protein